MRFNIEVTEKNEIVVVLSKRNLQAGLHKLEMEGSAREITSNDGTIVGVFDSQDQPVENFKLRLKFEDDVEHYNHPDRQAPHRPGEMHPDTEAFIKP